MKKETKKLREKIANDTLYYIYRYIDIDLNLDELAKMHSISRFHFYRIFKEEFGVNIYEMIKSIRLQKSANMLLTNRYSSISEISQKCGYSSHSSFIRAFRSRFNTPPKKFRDMKLNYKPKLDFSSLEPKIIKREKQKLYYIRHRGYSKSIKIIWQRLEAILLSRDITDAKSVAIYHDNPLIINPKECYYVASILIDEKIELNLPSLEFPNSVNLCFEIEGIYGDIIEFLKYIYLEYIPQNGFEVGTLPAFSIYHKNHFLSSDDRFKLDFYVPIEVI